MEVMEAMRARHSVRSYLPEAVEEEKLAQVLEAVRLTPSRHNDQNIKVVAVRDPEVKKRIRQEAQTQPMVEEADVLLAFCATGATDFVMPCGQYGYVVDMSLATGFAVLAAADQGLDSCIVCAFREEAVKEILGVPEEVRIVSMVVLGYGDDQSPRKVKKPVEEITSREHF